MLRQELAETNSQRTRFETETEKLKYSLKHIKEETVKEYEKVSFFIQVTRNTQTRLRNSGTQFSVFSGQTRILVN